MEHRIEARSPRRGRAWLASVLLLGFVVAPWHGSPAAATQAQWSSMNWSWARRTDPVAPVTQLQQEMRVRKLGPTSYASLTWRFGDGPGAYMGVQTNPTTPDGSPAPASGVNFAIWDATQAKGRHCGAFGGEGVGQRCIRAVAVAPGARVRLSVARTSFDSSTGEWWWTAKVVVSSRGVTKRIKVGSIRTGATHIDTGSITNFEEYFGDMPASCSLIPVIDMRFLPPRALDSSGSAVIYAFDRDRGLFRGPDPCSATGGANAMLAEVGASVWAQLGGSGDSRTGVLIRNEDGCLSDGADGLALSKCDAKATAQRFSVDAPLGDNPSGELRVVVRQGESCLTWSDSGGAISVDMEPCGAERAPRQQWLHREAAQLQAATASACLDAAGATAVVARSCTESSTSWSTWRPAKGYRSV